MEKNVIGRRRFLRSTAAGIIGIASGMAATGTAAAADPIPGIARVTSSSNSWDYHIRISDQFGTKPHIEKRGKADPADEVNDNYLLGNVLSGGVDNYWLPDKIYSVRATPDGWDSDLNFIHGTTNAGTAIAIDSTGSHFDYRIEYGGTGSDVTRASGAEESDETYGDYAVGHINAGYSDNFLVTGYLQEVFIWDPNSSSGGFKVRFTP